MGKYILADNQELTRFALESLIRSKGENDIFRASDKVGLVQLLKEHESAVVLLDYTLFDFADEDQLLIVALLSVLPCRSGSSSATSSPLSSCVVWSMLPTSSASFSRMVH